MNVQPQGISCNPVVGGIPARCFAALTFAFLFSLFAVAGEIETDPVRKASRSVLRAVMASPVDGGILSGEDAAAIRQKGWCAQKVMRGRNVAGYRFFFEHNGTLYKRDWTGSAYLISPSGHWVTNHHVTSIYDVSTGELATANTAAKLFLLVQMSPKGVFLPSETLWSNREKDLAVIRTEPVAGLEALVFADPDFIVPNLTVRSIGFPGASDALGPESGLGDVAGYLSPKITGGTLSNRFQKSIREIGTGRQVLDKQIWAWQHDAAISGGNSGGPLVNACGQVVGTNAFGHMEWQLANGAIDIQELLPNRTILPELRQFNIPYVQVAGACEPPGAGVPGWIYWSLGAIAALMAALVAGLLHVKSLLKSGRAIPGMNSVFTQKLLRPLVGSAPTVKRDLDGKNWKNDINGRWYRFDPVYGVIYRDDLPAAGPTLRLRSDSGSEIVLPAGKSTIIGSAPDRAQVVIDSKYVSGAHARLSNLDGRLMVEDLQSGNGTFIGDGRLTGTAELKAGDVLRLTARPGIAEYRLVTAGAEADGTREVWAAMLVPQFLGARTVAISARRPVTIGRAGGGNTIDIADASVSTRHCAVSVGADGRIELRDLGSLNGTFVEGGAERITTAVVEKGQRFYVANQVYSFAIAEAVGEK